MSLLVWCGPGQGSKDLLRVDSDYSLRLFLVRTSVILTYAAVALV